MLVTAAIVFVGLLAVLNLVLTFGMLRRLREHTEQLNGQLPELTGHVSTDLIKKKGDRVGNFATETAHGVALSSDMLTGETVLGFFAPGCSPCEQMLPGFIEYAAAMPGGRDSVVAVLAGDNPNSPEMVKKVTALDPYARVVIDENDGPVMVAFGAKGYPVVCLVKDGVVQASGRSLQDLPARVGV
jgi:thiol-disulfide isomerase/thioredoxin